MRNKRPIAILTLLLFTGAQTLALADADNELVAGFERVSQEFARDPEFIAYAQRLSLVETVASDVSRNFERFRARALNQLLDNAAFSGPTEAAPKSLPSGERDGPPPATAYDLLAKYSGAFAVPLPMPESADPAVRQVLHDSYQLKLREVGGRVAERGRSAVASNPKHTFHLVGLALVLPFLNVSDGNWSASDVEQLPAWLRQEQVLSHLEEVSLATGRPLTASIFASYGKPSSAIVDRQVYLSETANRLLRAGQFPAAIACLGAAAELAETTGGEIAVEQRMRLAEVLSDTGQPLQAAETLGRLQKAIAADPAFGKVAMLRLKYLYEAEQFAQVLNLGASLRMDTRCQLYLPQILYISWVAARRSDQSQAADDLRKQFLAAFGDHNLAADIYFAHAMEALAASNYEEATRLLEYIEFKFPQSRLAPKVKEIQKRLGSREPSGK